MDENESKSEQGCEEINFLFLISFAFFAIFFVNCCLNKYRRATEIIKWSQESYLNALKTKAKNEGVHLTIEKLKELEIMANLSAQRRNILFLAEKFMDSFKKGDIKDYETFKKSVENPNLNLCEMVLNFNKILKENNLDIVGEMSIKPLENLIGDLKTSFEAIKDCKDIFLKFSSVFIQDLEYKLDILFATRDYDLIDFVNTAQNNFVN